MIGYLANEGPKTFEEEFEKEYYNQYFLGCLLLILNVHILYCHEILCDLML
jgi:hypothetical protein